MEARRQRVRCLAAGLVLAAAGLGTAGLAHAHDSWLSPARKPAPPGRLALELSTGNRFPVQEFSTMPANITRAQCTDAAARRTPLRALRQQAQWTEMRARTGAGPAACWLEIKPAEIQIEPPLVQVYLDEIRAPQALRQAWAEMQARQQPWREVYRKFARIELASAGDAAPRQRAALRHPVGLDLEIVVLGEEPVGVGRLLTFQVLRDGQPLAGLPVELVSERSKLGIWRETDAQGVLQHSLPFAGRWLLRATDLRLSRQRADHWESRFVTLAIEAR